MPTPKLMGNTTPFSTPNLHRKYTKSIEDLIDPDYISSDPREVENILQILNLNFSNSDILEPTCGGGRMLLGIMNYIKRNKIQNCGILATDVAKRELLKGKGLEDYVKAGSEYDFLSNDFPILSTDYIIMFPPVNSFAGFCERALDIAEKGVLCLARVSVLFPYINYGGLFSSKPPTDIYVCMGTSFPCYKNNTELMLFQQGEWGGHYLWLYWDKEKINSKNTFLHWVRTAAT